MANSVLDLNWGGGFHSFLVALSGPIISNFEGTQKPLACATELVCIDLNVCLFS